MAEKENTSLFGVTADSREVHTFTIRNEQIEVILSDFGATILSLKVPDRQGNMTDVVLGYDCLEDYEKGTALFGATVGRVANRIRDARFILNGRTWCLDKNEGNNCNHSGFHGYQKRIWEAIGSEEAGEYRKREQIFRLESCDGDQGFPGNLRLKVKFSLCDESTFSIQYLAQSDQDTLLNVTNHSYFNLNGQGNGDIRNQKLRINASRYIPLRGEDSIPDGTIRSVRSTPFDFTELKKIGAGLDSQDSQIQLAKGYNHSYIISERKGEMRTAAIAECEESGIGMEVSTDLPCLQLYTGNELQKESGKKGKFYYPYCGFALETQYAPDSMNISGVEKCILHAGEVWRSETRYRFYHV